MVVRVAMVEAVVAEAERAAVARADAQAVKVAMVARAEGKEGTVEQAETAVETAAVVAWAVVGVTVVETAAKVERAA